MVKDFGAQAWEGARLPGSESHLCQAQLCGTWRLDTPCLSFPIYKMGMREAQIFLVSWLLDLIPSDPGYQISVLSRFS